MISQQCDQTIEPMTPLANGYVDVSGLSSETQQGPLSHFRTNPNLRIDTTAKERNSGLIHKWWSPLNTLIEMDRCELD